MISLFGWIKRVALMPDKRRHRGKHPEDDRLFAVERHADLRSAVADLAWLLTHGYADKSGLKLVGDRYDLTARQRLAVWRSSCSDQALAHRETTCAPVDQIRGRPLGIDGYNVLITVESALSGGLILIGRDGCYRDLAGIHGTYHRVDETLPALELIIRFVDGLQPLRIDWYLDRPVSNSGRLKVLLADHLERRRIAVKLRGTATAWNIELVANPDAVLATYDGIVASSDSFVLDRCPRWCNLAGSIIDQFRRRPDNPQPTWTLDLRQLGHDAEGFSLGARYDLDSSDLR